MSMATKKTKSTSTSKDENKTITYFAKPGAQNTKRALELGLKRAKQLGIKTVLVPSTSGKTGVEALDAVKRIGAQLVVVTLHFGFREKGKWTMDQRNVEALTKGGACIFTATHAFSGIERSYRKEFGGISIVEAVAYALKGLFGQGMKVAIEIGLMCADAGFAPVDEDILCFGGTSGGVDTAIIMRPSNMNAFFEAQVKEIICLPKEKEWK